MRPSLTPVPAHRRARTNAAYGGLAFAALAALATTAAFCTLAPAPQARAQGTPAPSAAKPPAAYVAPEEFGDVQNSVSRMKAFIAKRRAQEAAYKKAAEAAKKAGKTPPPAPARQGHKTAWYEAYLYRMELRAGPDDTVDWEAYPAAADHRDRMPAASINFKDESGQVGRPQRPDAVTAKPVDGGGRPPLQIITPPAAWEYVGPRNLRVPYTIYYGPSNSATSGRVSGLAYSPTDPNTIFLAAAGGGLWKTTNGGADWSALGDKMPFLLTSCVAVHPLLPDTVYVGTGDYDYYGATGGYSAGVMRSTDGGNTWTQLGTADLRRVVISALVIDPDNPNIVTASTGQGTLASARSVWRSTDGGDTWGKAAFAGWSAGDNGDFSDLKVSGPGTDGTRYYWAAARGGSRPGLYRSVDRGANWALVTQPAGSTGSGFEVAASPTDANVVYIIRSGDRKVWKGTRVAGATPAQDTYTWADITGATFPHGSNNYNWSQASYDIHLLAVPQAVGGVTRDVLYASLISLAGTTDGGVTWTDIGQTYTDTAKTHNDQHSLAYAPSNPNKLAVGNDGGVYGMTYNPSTGVPTIDGITWSRTLGVTQFYYADFHPTDPTRLLGGTQDNSTPAARGDLFNWINVGGGDGGGVAINPLNPLIQYCMSQEYGGPYRNTNGWATGNSYNSISPSISPIAAIRSQWAQDGKPFIGVMSIDPNWPNPMYIGTQYLWRWSEATQSWSGHLGPGGGPTGVPTGGQNLGGTVKSITVAPSNSQVIYVGCTNGNLWMTADYGATFTRLDDAFLPNRGVTDISVHPTNPFDIVLTLAGAGGTSGNVFRCTNTQAAPATFQNVSGAGVTAVPSITHNSITRDFTAPDNTFYVGTDVGVFMTENGGASWANATVPLGLPNVEVSTVRAMPRTGYLMCATYGRGAWRVPLVPNIPTRVPDVRVTQTVARNGTLYTFTVSLRNYGPVTATNPRITGSELRVGGNTHAPITALPLNVGSITYGNTVTFQVQYNLPGLSANTPAQFGVNGTFTYSGQTGTLGAASRVTLP